MIDLYTLNYPQVLTKNPDNKGESQKSPLEP